MSVREAADARRTIDNAAGRDFLKDHTQRFPVFQRPGRGADGYYAPQTAIATADGEAVNPLTVPYAALSTSLASWGDVDLGDVGLAIRASTGASSPFLYADAGGGNSTSVGEASAKLIGNLFGGRSATLEPIIYIVFPGTARPKIAEPDLMESKIRAQIQRLNQADNSDDLASYIANPSAWRPGSRDRARERIDGLDPWFFQPDLTAIETALATKGLIL